MKRKNKSPRTIRVPEEIDLFIKRQLEADPELTYASALRRLLRAGQADIESRRGINAGLTQVDMEALR